MTTGRQGIRIGRSEAYSIGRADIVPPGIFGLQGCVALACLAANFQLEQLAAALVVEEQRWRGRELGASVADDVTMIDAQAGSDPPGASDWETAAGTECFYPAHLGIAVGEGEYIEVAAAPEAGCIELRLVG